MLDGELTEALRDDQEAPAQQPATTRPDKKRKRSEGDEKNGQDGKDSTPTLDTSLIECSVCRETILDAIFQCGNGHLYCETCKRGVQPRCSVCRTVGQFSRGLILEKLFQDVTLKCEFCEDVQLPRNKLQSHSAFCAKRPFQICETCSECFTTADGAAEHLEKKHGHFVDSAKKKKKDQGSVSLDLKEGTKRVVRFGSLFVFVEWHNGWSAPVVFVRTICSHPTHMVRLAFGTNLPEPKLETLADFKNVPFSSRNMTATVPFIRSTSARFLATNIRLPISEARKFDLGIMDQWMTNKPISSSSSSSSSSMMTIRHAGVRTANIWLYCEPCRFETPCSDAILVPPSASSSSNTSAEDNDKSKDSSRDSNGQPKSKRARS